MHLDRYVLLGAMTMGICACGGAAGQEPSEAQMKEAALYAINHPPGMTNSDPISIKFFACTSQLPRATTALSTGRLHRRTSARRCITTFPAPTSISTSRRVNGRCGHPSRRAIADASAARMLRVTAAERKVGWDERPEILLRSSRLETLRAVPNLAVNGRRCRPSSRTRLSSVH